MTTLAEELEQAITCLRSRGPGIQFPAIVADELEARAAWVREHLETAARLQADGLLSEAEEVLLRRLTGPIPSETAPAAPKEGTVKP